MFLHALSFEERHALMALATDLVHADKVLENEEEARLVALRRKLALSADAKIPVDPLSVVPLPFRSRQSRIKVLAELLILANADDHIDERELTMIRETSRKFGIEDSVQVRLEAWVVQYQRLHREVLDL